jgi:cyclopropane-fatty-acyl-phospholipid synthase
MADDRSGAASGSEATLRRLLEEVGVTVGGGEPHDIQVHDPRFYRRVLRDGSLGLGESYVEGWWDAERVDAFIHRILVGGLRRKVGRDPRGLFLALWARLTSRQGRRRASRNVRSHYEKGLDLFEAMLDRRMVYSCAYWREADTLGEAQEAKLELTCRKLGLTPGMHLLDIGCGWGSLVRYAAERFDVRATGITLSPEQAEIAREQCRGLPVEIRTQDYRQVTGQFDAVVSVGMFEHVGAANHRAYMEAVARCLAPGGVSVLHTIGSNEDTPLIDPWIRKYIFPGAHLPSLGHIAKAAEGLFVVEDVHNFGPDYDRTVMAWCRNFEEAWPRLKDRYGEEFRRVWRYYLLSCAGSFRARETQLFQVVLSPTGRERGHLEALEPRLTEAAARSPRARE